MPKKHYEIKETMTYDRFRIIDSEYQVEIIDDKGDIAGSDKIVIKREHIPKVIEILTKILNDYDQPTKPIELEVNETMPEKLEGVGIVRLW